MHAQDGETKRSMSNAEIEELIIQFEKKTL